MGSEQPVGFRSKNKLHSLDEAQYLIETSTHCQNPDLNQFDDMNQGSQWIES